MPQKRSLSSILEGINDNNAPPPRNVRTRAISSLTEESSNQPNSFSNSRLEMCYCSKCHGNYVNSQTKMIHDSLEPRISTMQSDISEILVKLQLLQNWKEFK